MPPQRPDAGDGGPEDKDGPVAPIDPSAPLPPGLDPRGRRHAKRAAQQAAAISAPPAHSDYGSSAVRIRTGRRVGTARGPLQRGVVIGCMIVAALASTSVVAVSGWAWWAYKDFTANVTRLPGAVGGSGTPTSDIDGKDQNILIAGNDDRSTATNAELAELGTTRDGGSLNTDTMMILHVPADGSKATIISFPRDSYVSIPGYGKNKLNSAYPDAYDNTPGDALTKQAAAARELRLTIEALTGLTVDHFVQVDLLGFYRISNAIGGVPVVLCKAQKEGNSGIDLPAGRSVIEGKQALAFVRQRYGLPNGDLDRIKRQQYFLSSAFRQISSAGVLLNPFKLKDLLNSVDASLQMDSTLDPLQLANQMQNLSADNITAKTIPTDGFATESGAGSVVVVHPADVQAFVTQLIGTPTSTTAPVATVAPGSVSVDVLNASGVGGAATTSANALKADGFIIGDIDNATKTSKTVIKYPSGKQAQAQSVAAFVPGATLTEDRSVSSVTLVLGTDGLAAQTTSGASGTATTTPTAAPTTNVAPDAVGCIN